MWRGEGESQECSPTGVCVFTPNASGPNDDVDDDNNSAMCLGFCYHTSFLFVPFPPKKRFVFLLTIPKI